jgi:nucleotide-binding universal stress UspA family protein
MNMMTSQHPVVAGIDGSDDAVRAATYGAWEATRRRMPLRLVFAHQPTPMWSPGVLVADEYRWENDWVRAQLDAADKKIRNSYPDLRIEWAIVNASPAGALVDESRHASLVVVATHAIGGLVGHLSGSVAAQVAAHAHCPTIVARPTTYAELDPATFADRPIVVGLDGSRESEHAMDFAVEQAVARQTTLHAVYAWNVLEVHNIGAIVPDQFVNADEEAKALRLLTEATEGWTDRYPDLRIVRRVIHSLDPVDALTHARRDAGLIVVGSRGHGGFLGLRLGSTVDALIRNASAPVAVVRGNDADH